MAVYYKFKSAREYDSISMDGPFISVGTLKQNIFESKHLGRGTDFDLLVTNAQTNEEYLDEAMLIPKNTSVLIRRVPGRPRMPIITEQEPKVEDKEVDTNPERSSFSAPDFFTVKNTEDSEWDEFGNDLYAIPEVVSVQSVTSLQDAPPSNKAEEDSKIKALIDTPALDWQRQGPDGFGPGRGFGRGMAGRMAGRGFGLERKTPPQGYVCHRCKVPGHFIQHCPTNGDPNYDVRRVKPPTGIPKSMLMATPDGSYALPSGAAAVLTPNEAAFEKEIEGLPSTRYVGDLPPEFHCPLCKEVMKDAVLTSKCCFKSFCDKCIRGHVISKSTCVCGATDVLADDLLPNKTLRETINRILESGNSSAENAGSTFHVPDMESARCPPPRIPSPTLSAASKGEQIPSHAVEDTPNLKESVYDAKAFVPPKHSSQNVRTGKAAEVSEATHESMTAKEPASQGSAPPVEEEVQQKLPFAEAGKRKKKKKVRLPTNGTAAVDMQWKPQDLAAENYMMPMGPTGYNPYWVGMQPGIESYMAPYAGSMPYMGYGLGPMDMPFGGMMPQDPFAAQAYMMSMVPTQRDLGEFGMGMNAAASIRSREEFEARKAELRRKRENDRSEREFSKDREYSREVNSMGSAPPVKLKSKSSIPQTSRDEHHNHHHGQRAERFPPERELEPPRPAAAHKRKSEHNHVGRDRERDRERDRDRERSERYIHDSSKRAPSETAAAAVATKIGMSDRKHKPSVFSRISFPEGEVSKKPKVSSSENVASSTHKQSSSSAGVKAVSASGGGGSMKAAREAADYKSSDDDRHFKRKPSRYEPSPPPPPQVGVWERTSREQERGSKDYDRNRYNSKHR